MNMSMETIGTDGSLTRGRGRALVEAGVAPGAVSSSPLYLSACQQRIWHRFMGSGVIIQAVRGPFGAKFQILTWHTTHALRRRARAVGTAVISSKEQFIVS